MFVGRTARFYSVQFVDFGSLVMLGTFTDQALGLSDAQLAMAFIPGSLIGIVVQPIVGVLSDNLQSYYGKRRPFIAGGAVLLVAGYGVVANAYGTQIDCRAANRSTSKMLVSKDIRSVLCPIGTMCVVLFS